jgi:hypothetical protein
MEYFCVDARVMHVYSLSISQSSVRMIFLMMAKHRPKRVINTVNKEERFNMSLLFTEIVLY